MAVSIWTCCILLYGIPFLFSVMTVILSLFSKAPAVFVGGNAVSHSSESTLDGMMWFDLGQTD